MTKGKNKKQKINTKNIVLIITIVALMVIVGLAYSVYQDAMAMAEGSEVVEEMKNEYYTIRSNATDYQKELYDELTVMLNSEEGLIEDEDVIAVANIVVKSYVADFYTWTNKQGSYDIGGLEYIYAANLTNFNNYARDKFYSRLSSDIIEYGQENLLEVVSVETKGNYAPVKFVRNGEDVRTFYIEAEWTYKESEVFNTSVYQTKGYFTVIINENGRYEIVSYLEG